MNRIYDRLRDTAANAGGGLRDAMSWHDPRGRVRVVVAGAAATLLAIGVGVWWGIADADGPSPATAGAALSPGSSPDVLSESEPSGPPGDRVTGGGPPPAGSGGAGTGSGTGSGAGAGTGGGSGGPPGDPPPVIETPGLSSDGLRLRITPTVTVGGEQVALASSGGEGVTAKFLVDGEEVPFDAMGQQAASVEFDHDQVGYTHRATVEIEVTDEQGTTVRETYFHDLEAVTAVTVREVSFRLQAPALCLASGAAQRLEGDLRLRGAIDADIADFSEELRSDRTTVVLLDRISGEVPGAPATQRILLSNATLDGADDSASFSHDGSAEKLHRLFAGTPCRGYFSYKITFAVR